jgi:hypothetical protein
MIPVVPPRINGNNKRPYNKELRKKKCLIENIFMKMKRCIGIAARYCKNLTSFISAVHICFVSIQSKSFDDNT